LLYSLYTKSYLATDNKTS